MITAPAQTGIADGFYTIVSGNTHRTFRVRPVGVFLTRKYDVPYN